MSKIISLLLLTPVLLPCILDAVPAGHGVAVIARLSASSGNVLFRTGEDSVWRKAVPGMSFERGDTIKTGDSSWATVFLANGSMVRTAANSTVEISKLAYDRKKNAMKLSLKINPLGRIIATVKKIGKDSHQMDVYTPQAVVGVRGTDLLVDVPDKDTTVTGVWDGQVIVKDFVGEAGLSTDDNTMTLNFAHEISVGKDEFSRYSRSKGFSRPKNLAADYENDRMTVAEMKTQSDRILESDSPEEQTKAAALRKKALQQ